MQTLSTIVQLSWTSTAAMVTAVYIHPNANHNLALSHLHNAINLQLNTYPDAVHVIAENFNHADQNAVLSKA